MVLCCGEYPAQLGCHSEYREVFGRYDCAHDAFRISAFRIHHRARRCMGRNRSKSLRLRLNILEVGKGKSTSFGKGLTSSTLAQSQQLFLLRKRKWGQDHCINHTKNGRVGADPQHNGKQSYGGETWMLEQASNPKT